MRVESEQGKGSVFYFTLPYVLEEEMKDKEKKIFNVEDTKDLSNKKILVAEDIESNFRLIKYFLSAINAEIIWAENGKEAIESYRANNDIDLILMDIKMPVMDGYDAIKAIRALNKDIPIIAQTAYADDRIKVIESGCNGFISKPFDRQRLLTLIRAHI